MTTCGVAVEEVAFFSDSEPGTYMSSGRMDNPDFWHEVSVTRLSLGADRVISDFTSDDDHHVGSMVRASAGALWRGGCDSNGVCDVAPNGSAHRFGSMARSDRTCRVLVEDFSPLETDGSRVVR